MTCKMAAGQQKKRVANSNFYEQYKGKKKRSEGDCVLNLRPHICLEWDNNKKQASAKKEQIGITWKDMAPFVDSAPQFCSGLADVLFVPQEIFGLENLAEVLSYEVWATCLSESERKNLTQFLPSGAGAEQEVQSLLMGENHHFGNPFLKWSASLCSGDLHPDNVLCAERQSRTNKKAYYSELNQYRTEMIEVLKKWKERWENCNDPEKLSRGFTEWKQETVTSSTEIAKASTNLKKEMAPKIVRNGDTDKFISYIKINKKQYDELVKNLKHSSDGIQSKSLNRVIGDISKFDLHPYEAFEEEEANRLHKHWLQMVNKDIPAAFAVCRDRKSQRQQCRTLLEEELARISIIDKGKETRYRESSPLKQMIDNGPRHHYTNAVHQDAVNSPSNYVSGHHLGRNPSLNSCQELSPVVLHQEAQENNVVKPAENSHAISQFLGEKKAIDGVMASRSSISVAPDDHLEQIPSLNSHQGPRHITRDHEVVKNDVAKPAENTHVISQLVGEKVRDQSARNNVLKPPENSHALSQYLGEKVVDNVMNSRSSTSPIKEMWQNVSIQNSNYPTTSGSHRYTSSDLSLRQPQAAAECPTGMIDLERNILEHEGGESVASAMHMGSGVPLFYPYESQSRNDLSLFRKEPGLLPVYPHDQMIDLKQHHRLQTLMETESLPESSHFPHQFQGQQRFMEQRQAKEKELLMNEIMKKSMYSNGRYPSQGHVSSVEPHGMVPLRSSANGGPLSRWFSEGHHDHNDWPGVKSSGDGHYIGDGGNNTDGSLFSVLSECNKLPSRAPYDTATSEQFAQVRNIVGSSVQNNTSAYMYPSQQAKSLGNHDLSVTQSELNMSWMNYPHQNPNLHDAMGKSFLRSWNK